MQILYITYVNLRAGSYGSVVRPRKMMEAFLAAGHEVKLLSEDQGKHSEARRAAVEETSRWLDDNRPDLCYIESPVYPIMQRCDIRLIRKIHRLGIPMGYFCRDFYWKFPEVFPRRSGPIGWLKDRYLDYLQWRTDHSLHNMDIVYFPSMQATKYFPYRDMRALPPAGENRLKERMPELKTGIYVGGLDTDYGVAMLLEAFELLNSGNDAYKLILVCREHEWEDFESPLRDRPWLEVHHTSGEGLEPLYDRAAVGFIPVQLFEYNHLSVNVKLFEYMGHGLPMIVTDAHAIASIVRENDIGTVVPHDAAAMAEAIKDMLSDEEKRKAYEANSRKALLEGNLWVHRAEKVVNDLSSIKKD